MKDDNMKLMEEYASIILPNEAVGTSYRAVGIYTGGGSRPINIKQALTQQQLIETLSDIDGSPYDAYAGIALYRKYPQDQTPSKKKIDVVAVRCLVDDLDVGIETNKYNTKDQALEAAHELSLLIGVKPYIVDSGSGIHLYWRCATDMDALQWEELSKAKRELNDALFIKSDKAVDINCAVILRPPGTHNKKSGAPVPVAFIQHGETSPYSYLKASINNAVSGLTGSQRGARKKPVQRSVVSPPEVYIGEASEADKLADNCAAMNDMRESGGSTEPLWYYGIRALKLCDNGHEIAHQWSAKHPEYSQDKTDAKWNSTAMAPFTCGAVNDTFECMATCHLNKNKEPNQTPMALIDEQGTPASVRKARANADLVNTARKAAAVWDLCTPLESMPEHQYSTTKGWGSAVPAPKNVGLIDYAVMCDALKYSPRFDKEPDQVMVVPMFRPDGSISTLELIDDAGTKRKIQGKDASTGAFWLSRSIRSEDTIIIAEGVATAHAASQAFNHVSGGDNSVAVATLSEGNIPNVAEIFKGRDVILAADLDANGLLPNQRTMRAARKYGLRLAYPGIDIDTAASKAPDFADMVITPDGLTMVGNIIKRANRPFYKTDDGGMGSDLNKMAFGQITLNDNFEPASFRAIAAIYVQKGIAPEEVIRGCRIISDSKGLKWDTIKGFVSEALAHCTKRNKKALISREASNMQKLQLALSVAGIEVRLNERSNRFEHLVYGQNWVELSEGVGCNMYRNILPACVSYYAAPRCKSMIIDSSSVKSYETTKPSFYDDIAAACVANSVDPFLEWLEGLPTWDGVPRINSLISYCFDVETSKELSGYAGFLVMGGAVSRAYRPGCKHDYAVLLVGNQGTNKSLFFKAILPDEKYFNDTLTATMKPREVHEAAGACVISEISEGQGLNAKETEATKAMVSRTNDRARAAYARNAEDRPRRFVIVATSNNPNSLPDDDSGNRRFIRIVIRDKERNFEQTKAMLDYIDGIREQLWAEAIHRVQVERESLELPSHLKLEQKQGNDDGRAKNELLEGYIEQFVDESKGFSYKITDWTMNHVFVEVNRLITNDGMKALDYTKANQKTFKSAMLSLGYTFPKRRLKTDNTKVRNVFIKEGGSTDGKE